MLSKSILKYMLVMQVIGWGTYSIIQQESFTVNDVKDMYRKVSNIRRTISQNLNDSRLVLQWYLPNPLKSGVESRMKI